MSTPSATPCWPPARPSSPPVPRSPRWPVLPACGGSGPTASMRSGAKPNSRVPCLPSRSSGTPMPVSPSPIPASRRARPPGLRAPAVVRYVIPKGCRSAIRSPSPTASRSSPPDSAPSISRRRRWVWCRWMMMCAMPCSRSGSAPLARWPRSTPAISKSDGAPAASPRGDSRTATIPVARDSCAWKPPAVRVWNCPPPWRAPSRCCSCCARSCNACCASVWKTDAPPPPWRSRSCSMPVVSIPSTTSAARCAGIRTCRKRQTTRHRGTRHRGPQHSARSSPLPPPPRHPPPCLLSRWQ